MSTGILLRSTTHETYLSVGGADGYRLPEIGKRNEFEEFACYLIEPVGDTAGTFIMCMRSPPFLWTRPMGGMSIIGWIGIDVNCDVFRTDGIIV